MRWKVIAVAAVLAIIVAMAGLYVYLKNYEYNKLKPLIAGLVEEATGRRLTLGGDISLALAFPPELVATDIALANADWGSQPQMILVERLQVRVRLLGLVLKRLEVVGISLQGVKVLLETGPDNQKNWSFPVSAGRPSRLDMLAPTKIDVNRIDIENLRFAFHRYTDAAPTQFTVTKLTVSGPENEDNLTVELQAAYKKQPVTVSGKIGKLNDLLAHRRFPLQLSGNLASAGFEVKGVIKDLSNLDGIDVHARLSGDNLAAIGSALDINLPETKAFEVSGNLAGSRDSLQLEAIDATLSGTAANLAVSGRIGDLTALSGLDLNLKAAGKNLAQIGEIIGQKLPPTDDFTAQGRLTGSAGHLSLAEAKGSADHGSLSLSVEGGISDLTAVSGLDLNLKAAGNNLAQIGEIIGQKLPPTDDFTAQGRLTGSAGHLSLTEAKGSADRGSLSLAVEGGINDLLSFSGVDLAANGSGKDLSEVGTIIGEKLPSTNEFAVRGQLTGSAEALGLKTVQGSARRGGLEISVTGDLENLPDLKGLNLQVKASGGNLAEVGSLIGEKLPVTREYIVNGRLTGSATALSVPEVQGSARRGNLHISVSGRVKNLLDLQGLDLQSSLTGKNLTEFGDIIDEKLPATDRFEIRGRLTGTTKSLSLKQADGSAVRGNLNLEVKGDVRNLIALQGMDLNFQLAGKDLTEIEKISGTSLPAIDNFSLAGRLKGSPDALSLQEATGSAGRGGLHLAFTGGIQKLLELGGIDVKLDASGKELAEIGPLIGTELPELGAFELDGTLTGSPRFLQMDGLNAIIDKSDLRGLAKVEFLERPKITLRLESGVLDLTALMNGLDKEASPKPPSTPRDRVFSNDPLPFDALDKVDADIDVKAQNIHAMDARLTFGRMILKLDNGAFSIDKFEAKYKGADISGTFERLPVSPSRLTCRFLVQQFDLGGFLKETGVDDQVQAVVDFAADLNSRGNSAHSLVANLDGSMGAVMGKGYLSQYFNLISVDLSKEIFKIWKPRTKASQIKCAVVQFDITDGLAVSQAFVFNSQDAVLTGKGEVNLDTEKINFLLVPKPKHPGVMEFSTNLRVSGTLMDPKVKPDNFGLLAKGARALSALAIGPIGLLAPFVSLGAMNRHPCRVEGLEDLGLESPDAKKPKEKSNAGPEAQGSKTFGR